MISGATNSAVSKNIVISLLSGKHVILSSLNFLEGNAAPLSKKGDFNNRGWYKINTWVGERWIHPGDYIVGAFIVENTRQENLYGSINDTTKDGEVSPQLLTANKRAGSGKWFQVDTYLGKKWINPDGAIVDARRMNSETLLDGENKGYTYPDDDFYNKTFYSYNTQSFTKWKALGEFGDEYVRWLNVKAVDEYLWIKR